MENIFCIHFTGRIGGNLARPLRPGPRINLAARGRPGAVTSTTTAASIDQENSATEAQQEEEKVKISVHKNIKKITI